MGVRYYFWIVARDETGKRYLVFGSDKSEAEAREKGLEMLGGVDFEVKRWPTRDLARASSIMRGKRLEQTHSLSRASQRIGHTKSLRRLRRRHRQAGTNW